VADNPHAIARQYAQQKGLERLDADLAGWHPQRAGDDPTPAEVEAFRQWQTACDRLSRKPDGLAGREAAVELIKARRRVTTHGIWSPK
jgi:hypothetical protein